MTATAPAHFLRLQPIDLVARRDGRLGIRIGRQRITLDQRMRHQWCSPRTRGERHATCRKSKGEFQKVPGVPSRLLLCASFQMSEEFQRVDMNAR
jgi:hypothetical protein